jgi:hypothetical protein
MPDKAPSRTGKLLGRRKRNWYEQPRLRSMLELVRIRNELRKKNLHDTEEPPLASAPVPPNLDPALREARTVEGTYNDLETPTMGCTGRRFGRNVPLEHTFPDTANLLVPNPRVISRELMTRDQFQPARILNLTAAAWIQFMVHDWFVHKRSTVAAGIDIPLAPGDDWPSPKMRVPRSVPDPAPAGSTRPPAYANINSHWWDGSQIYGCDQATASALRTRVGGKLLLDANGLLSVDPVTGIHITGFTDNWWIGLAMLHTLFTREHNHVCDLLAREHPKWSDDQLYGKARLITSALMAKIHTVEWTPAIVPHEIVQLGMKTNWYGLLKDETVEVLKFLKDNEFWNGIPGSRTEHHAAPYSLTEEFAAVYRMHPLMPDSFTFRSAASGAFIESLELPAISGRHAKDIGGRIAMPDLFYSFGVSHPGAITLHNYPRHLQNLRLENGEHFDLAAVDVLRDRERGVPRYNQFRRLLRKDPVASFDELTDNPAWRQQIKQVYGNDIEKVDLMTGLFAEPLPEGFGFSETAFRLFILMASRRLKSDRFLTSDFRPEIYTEFGRDYVNYNTMLTVLKRHYPSLAPALAGVENAFHPWKKIGGV